jgi:hypothetical protein
LQHHILSASSEPDFDTAFATFSARHIDALVIGNDALFNSRRSQLVALAMRYGIPAIYPLREFAEVGRPHELWTESCGRVSAGRHLYWPDSQRR